MNALQKGIPVNVHMATALVDQPQVGLWGYTRTADTTDFHKSKSNSRKPENWPNLMYLILFILHQSTNS